MSTTANTTQLSLAESTRRVDPSPGPVDWRQAYHRHGGDIGAISQATGTPESVVREKLGQTVLHSSLELEQGKLARFLPHEIEGMSPLGCGECGAEGIVVHPCPECGYNPGGGEV